MPLGVFFGLQLLTCVDDYCRWRDGSFCSSPSCCNDLSSIPTISNCKTMVATILAILVACSVLAPALCFQQSLHTSPNQGMPLHMFNWLGKGKDDATPTPVAPGSKGKQTALHMFNWLGKGKGDATPTPVAPGGKGKQTAPLEKISNKQNRDWAAESKALQPKAQEVRDKQVTSFNFNKADEFPNLYKGWIRTEGDQIGKQIIAATQAALKSERYIEVLIDPVPNLDEVAFGTVWNKKFAEDVVKELKVREVAKARFVSLYLCISVSLFICICYLLHRTLLPTLCPIERVYVYHYISHITNLCTVPHTVFIYPVRTTQHTHATHTRNTHTRFTQHTQHATQNTRNTHNTQHTQHATHTTRNTQHTGTRLCSQSWWTLHPRVVQPLLGQQDRPR
jgi:hypothetical protein